MFTGVRAPVRYMDSRLPTASHSMSEMSGEGGRRTRLGRGGRAGLVEVAHDVGDQSRVVLEDLVPSRRVRDVLGMLENELHRSLPQAVRVVNVGNDEKRTSVVVREPLH